MKTLEQLKNQWQESQGDAPSESYNTEKLTRIINKRIGKNLRTSFQFFWASFTLQLIVYALLTHVIVTHLHDTTILMLSCAGISIYIPFTIILLNRFKKLAVTRLNDEAAHASVFELIKKKQQLLQSFYTFKRQYEVFLIPVITALGTILIYQIYVPGGVQGHIISSTVTFILFLAGCIVAIVLENRKSFNAPLQNLDTILSEYSEP